MSPLLQVLLLAAVIAQVYPSGAVPSIRLEDLPTHPESDCSSAAFKAAFGQCLLLGAMPACCTGLDAVYANHSSLSYGCRCYPDVLYKTILRGSEHGMDVLRLLKTCKDGPTDAFATPWAAKEAHDPQTSCPYIPLGASSAAVIRHMGAAAVLPSARARPTWAWGDLLQFGEVHQEVGDIHGVWQEYVGLQVLQMVFAVAICAAPIFYIMHRVLLCSAAYRALQVEERLVACQHGVYAAVFGFCLIPQTILACIALFKAWTGDYLASTQFTALFGVFLASRVVLYVVEGSARSIIKPSWLLLVHHQLFFVIIVMATWTTNIAVMGIGVVLDLFACHEAPLYVALVAYRLRWRTNIIRAILLVACAWYLITRVFQTVAILYMIVGFSRASAINTTPAFIITVVLVCALTFIQGYTLVIYHALYRKVASFAHVHA